jgi:hypothetical protein
LTSTTAALLQISAFGADQLNNQAKGIQYCRQAARISYANAPGVGGLC